jgi:hypothetical protein
LLMVVSFLLGPQLSLPRALTLRPVQTGKRQAEFWGDREAGEPKFCLRSRRARKRAGAGRRMGTREAANGSCGPQKGRPLARRTAVSPASRGWALPQGLLEAQGARLGRAKAMAASDAAFGNRDIPRGLQGRADKPSGDALG